MPNPKHPAVASADDRSHDQPVIARASGGPGPAGPGRSGWSAAKRGGWSPDLLHDTGQVSTDSAESGRVLQPARRQAGHHRTRPDPAGADPKKPHRCHIGPAATAPMSHRAGCCASHWPHGPRRPPWFAAGGYREPPGKTGLGQLEPGHIFTRPGAGVPGLPSAAYQVRKCPARAAADHRSDALAVMRVLSPRRTAPVTSPDPGSRGRPVRADVGGRLRLHKIDEVAEREIRIVDVQSPG